MQAIAKEVGYSETVFASAVEDEWRVRYFAPEMEVPFCGHATIALGGALARKRGNGIYKLALNHAQITVEGRFVGGQLWAALQSPRTHTEAVSYQVMASCQNLFSYDQTDLDDRIPPVIASAGVRHLIVALRSRQAVRAMRYDFECGRTLMNGMDLTTILFAFAETPDLFHVRNAFASGGVYEDPATGAGAAALAGYLRDLKWQHGGRIEIFQGEDMGCRSHLTAEIPLETGSSIRVSGAIRCL